MSFNFKFKLLPTSHPAFTTLQIKLWKFDWPSEFSRESDLPVSAGVESYFTPDWPRFTERPVVTDLGSLRPPQRLCPGLCVLNLESSPSAQQGLIIAGAQPRCVAGRNVNVARLRRGGAHPAHGTNSSRPWVARAATNMAR